MKRNCPKGKKDLKDEKPSIVGVVEDSNLFNGGSIFLAGSESLEKSYWTFDSGCSFHMFSVREHFYTYQPCEKCVVNMGNGA